MTQFWTQFGIQFLTALILGLVFAMLARWLRSRKKP